MMMMMMMIILIKIIIMIMIIITIIIIIIIIIITKIIIILIIIIRRRRRRRMKIIIITSIIIISIIISMITYKRSLKSNMALDFFYCTQLLKVFYLTIILWDMCIFKLFVGFCITHDGRKTHQWLLRPRKKYCLFPVTV